MLKTQKVYVIHEFNAPVAKVFSTLSEHENLSKIFAPAKVTRLNDGKDARNGVGSARKLSIPLTPSFVETNLVYRENELIEYAITSGIAPIKEHRGVMKFIDLDGKRTRLEYTITFKGRVPFIGPIIKAALQDGVARGLKKLRF
ncbi:SRPBCC family protein [Aquirhabdus parva]|uniref:SRPBCC family protein n=1 Tax=Aquirhabdus parva TaxID=2283318 RepID=A0A345P916_9GAMM|nr:SRPBCC family protein [Aquirhabdus parva]AXI03775.1 SRPBCC family protein [Aquirhabdus parva]